MAYMIFYFCLREKAGFGQFNQRALLKGFYREEEGWVNRLMHPQYFRDLLPEQMKKNKKKVEAFFKEAVTTFADLL